MKKRFCIGFFWLFSLYAPAELTRYILAYEKQYGFACEFQYEISFIWICYVIMMTLFSLILWTKWED